jgi:hypothetical protein
MSAPSHEDLTPIRFAGELLPNLARLLDLAARLCPIPEELRSWFSRLTLCSGVEDSRIVIANCMLLRASIRENQESIIAELHHTSDPARPAKMSPHGCTPWTP